MFVLVTAGKLLLPDPYAATNLTFYMTLITLLLVLVNLGKNSFPAGYLKLQNETKV